MLGTHPWCHMIFWPRGNIMSRDKLKTKHFFLGKAFGHQTWQSGDLWWRKLTHNVKSLSDHVITWGHVAKVKLNILSDAMPMTTKHGGLMTYGDSNPPVESHDSLRMWWQVVRWQIESITYPFWQGLWQWNLASWRLNVKRRHPWSNIFPWPPGHIKSCETLRTKYFFLQKMHGRQPLQDPDIWWSKAQKQVAQLWSLKVTFRVENLISPLLQAQYHQTWNGGEVSWKDSTHGVTWLFVWELLRGDTKNIKRSISSSSRPKAPKLGK